MVAIFSKSHCNFLHESGLFLVFPLLKVSGLFLGAGQRIPWADVGATRSPEEHTRVLGRADESRKHGDRTADGNEQAGISEGNDVWWSSTHCRLAGGGRKQGRTVCHRTPDGQQPGSQPGWPKLRKAPWNHGTRQVNVRLGAKTSLRL